MSNPRPRHYGRKITVIVFYLPKSLAVGIDESILTFASA